MLSLQKWLTVSMVIHKLYTKTFMLLAKKFINPSTKELSTIIVLYIDGVIFISIGLKDTPIADTCLLTDNSPCTN